jgi:hypothetical protein
MEYYLFTKGIENMTKNWDELCDEEKSFLQWINNQDEINNKIFDILKTVYMQGYAAGFQARLKYSSDEHLQK